MFVCSNCQKTYSKWQGRCDSCGQWGTITEVASSGFQGKGKSKGKGKTGISNSIKPIRFIDLGKESSDKKQGTSNRQLVTGIHEFDNALGGRLVSGQVLLLSGAPGVGKSTLSAQITEAFSQKGLNVLYICGEESPDQIAHRVKRLGLKHENVSFLPETNMAEVESYVASNLDKVDVMFVDSIQTMYDPNLPSTSGSVSQISESTNRITNLAKGFGITTFIIGHITKAGDIAGPKVLEHMVDTVIYFEGDKRMEFRILRVEKNRYGPTDEVGLFRMSEKGLTEVKDTKELFDPNKSDAPGSVYSMVMEGTRPVVVEVQALASRSYFSNPRRTTSGFDLNRLFIILAIIEKKLKLNTGELDVYVNITGGIKVNDSGLDLAVIKAVISSIKNEIIPKTSIFFGEVGLTGEVRKIFLEDKRIKESKRLGFENIYSNKNMKRVV
ncbi:MAG: DNA repair protein RadA [Candidatus Dojkabacteria bacterium]